jgi:steroid delta-isomerase-like uncharacterized protein
VEHLLELVKAGDVDGVAECFALDCVFVDVPSGDTAIGRESLRTLMVDYYAGLPDYHAEIERLIVDANIVAVELTLKGTHRGPFMGCEASGRQVSWRACAVYDLALDDGLVTKETYYYDAGDLMSQLGAP